ncbi:MAG: phosphohistidine phosphatase SixA [Prochloraceae cyanobacterium]
MELYLIRHGIAVERDLETNDAKRPLSDLGRKKTLKVARRLVEIGLNFEIILTSPLLRATQTAEILQQAGLSAKVEIFPPLAPGKDIQGWIDWYLQPRYNKREKDNSIALVGHQPDLGNWTELLVTGRIQGKLILKKAGTIGVRISKLENPIGKSELFLLTSPKWLL